VAHVGREHVDPAGGDLLHPARLLLDGPAQEREPRAVLEPVAHQGAGLRWLEAIPPGGGRFGRIEHGPLERASALGFDHVARNRPLTLADPIGALEHGARHGVVVWGDPLGALGLAVAVGGPGQVGDEIPHRFGRRGDLDGLLGGDVGQVDHSPHPAPFGAVQYRSPSRCPPSARGEWRCVPWC
jgi:hypothetical protein